MRNNSWTGKLTQDFSENEDQDHADKESWLLGSSTDTSIANDTDREASSHTSEADGETSTELDETGVESVILLLKAVRDQDRHDKTVDTNDTSHNDGDDVWKMRRLGWLADANAR